MDVGVVIGRFQVDDLTEGHLFLINQAFMNHRRVIVMVGIDPMPGTRANPLDYATRERMIRARFPDAITVPLEDKETNEAWSQQVDALIRLLVPNVSLATLYGGRDSFGPCYKGNFTSVEVDGGMSYQNGTQKREDIGKLVLDSIDFRRGIIHSTQNSNPRPVVCVMVVLQRENEVLTFKKMHETLFHLPYYIPDYHDPCMGLEVAATRAIRRVCDIEVSDLRYATSMTGLSPWELKKATELQPLTVVFRADYKFGSSRASHPELVSSFMSFEDLKYKLDAQSFAVFTAGPH